MKRSRKMRGYKFFIYDQRTLKTAGCVDDVLDYRLWTRASQVLETNVHDIMRSEIVDYLRSKLK